MSASRIKAITLRDLPAAIDRAIRERAVTRGFSRNKAVISLLEEATGAGRGKPRKKYHDLDRMAGTWTVEEAKQFERALADQRQIDEDLWK